MKLWRYGVNDTLNTTETRAVLAVKLTIWIHVTIAAFALAALVAFLWKGKVVDPPEFWLWLLTIVLSFNGALHGIAWGSGYTKQKTAETVARADVLRQGVAPTVTTTTVTQATAPANAAGVSGTPPAASAASASAQLAALTSRQPFRTDDESRDA
jgi:hypothetical protein